jgi:hypothetical protein
MVYKRRFSRARVAKHHQAAVAYACLQGTQGPGFVIFTCQTSTALGSILHLNGYPAFGVQTHINPGEVQGLLAACRVAGPKIHTAQWQGTNGLDHHTAINSQGLFMVLWRLADVHIAMHIATDGNTIGPGSYTVLLGNSS